MWAGRRFYIQPTLIEGNERMPQDPMNVLSYINNKLNGNKCPTQGCWGECPAISDQHGHYGNKYQIATIYWWREPPEPSTVKAWIEECGFACYSIDHVLWCDDGIAEVEDHGTVANWNVSFGPQVPEQPTRSDAEEMAGQQCLQ